MDRELMKSAEQFHIRRRQRSVWKKLVSVLGCIVVFCTTYALILPAITMERETICGSWEHQHSESCYMQQVVKQMVCSAKDTGVHTHSAECGSDCGYADFVIHEHAAVCYDGSGSLVCTLPEVKAHTHTDACYRIPTWEEPGHTHAGDCYTYEMRVSCGKTETEGHTHTDDCRQQKQVLCCDKSDHSHGTGCYGDDGTLTCSVEEHHHADACYQTETVLACGKEESEPHRHTDACYAEEKTLICTEKEGPIVRQGDPELVCGRQEVETHQHSAACFDASGTWICGKREILSHTHTDACFETVTEPVLTCGLEEHTHSDECYPAEETTAAEETVSGMMNAMYSVMALGKGVTDTDISLLSESVLPVNSLSEGDKVIYNKDTGLYETKVSIGFAFAADKQPDASVTYTYTYPSGVIIPEGELNKSMTLLDSSKRPAGTYQFTKNEDGTYSVMVVFNTEYVNTYCNKGETVTGFVNFEGGFAQSSVQADGSIHIDGGALQINIPSEKIEYPGNETNNYDISTSKQGEWSKSGKTLTYTVYVRTTKGTPDPIHFTDTITIPEGLGLDSPDVKVYKGTTTYYDGWQQDGTPEEKSGRTYQFDTQTGVLTMTLDGLTKLEPVNTGNYQTEYYKVTYTYSITGEDWVGEIKPGNTVKVFATDTTKNQTISAEASSVVTLSKSTEHTLEKDGQEEGTRIKWTLTVNKNQVNIAGATLTDDLLQAAENLEVSPNSGYERDTETGKITFTGDTNENQYTITYYTTPGEGVTKVSNHAVLDPTPAYPNSGDEKPAEKTVDISLAGLNKRGSYNKETGKIDWTIEVNGNGKDIAGLTLNDSFFSALTQGNFTIHPESGYQFLTGEDGVITGIQFTGESNTSSYTIRYSTVPNTPDPSGETKITNTASMDNGVTKPAEVTVPKISLTKSGEYADGQITWCVIINTEERDIAGYELTDTMFAGLEASAIKVSYRWFGDASSSEYNIKTKEDGTLAVTFNAIGDTGVNTNAYKLTYVTAAESEWDERNVANNALLKKGEINIPASAEVTVPGIKNVWKKVGTLVPSEDGKTAAVDWTVTVSVPSDGLPAGTVITDDVTKNVQGATNTLQWMTEEQIKNNQFTITWMNAGGSMSETSYLIQNGAVASNVTLQFRSSDGTVCDYANVDANKTYIGMIMTFADGLMPPEGIEPEKLSFTYSTTVDLEHSGIGTSYFYNTVAVGDKKADDFVTYEKSGVVKTDGSGNTGTSNTTSDGELVWKVKVKTVGSGLTSVTVIDTLPNGVLPKTIQVEGDGTQSVLLTVAANNTISGDGSPYHYSGTYDPLTKDVSLTITNQTAESALLEDQEWNLTFVCAADDAVLPPGTMYKLTNSVTVESNQGTIGSASQIQNWTHTKTKEETKEVQKTGKWDNNNRLLNYSIVLNPEGSDLVDRVDTLTLTDELTYPSKYIQADWYDGTDSETFTVKADLIQNSVRLFEASWDGGQWVKSTEITAFNWVYNTVKGTDFQETVTSTLTVSGIPDKQPLIFEYSYFASSSAETHKNEEKIQFDLPFRNEAKLTGTDGSDTSSFSNVKWSHSSSSAGVTTSGEHTYTFYKVKKGSFNATLPGAVFSVYEYSKTYGWSTDPIGTYTTNDEGQFEIAFEDVNSAGNKIYKHNTLYRICETTAPSGYIKTDNEFRYFYFSNTEDPNYMPDTIQSGALDLSTNAGSAYVENAPAEITVQKVWKDSGGNTFDKTGGSVTINLYQKTSQGSSSGGGGSGASISYTASCNNGLVKKGTFSGISVGDTIEIRVQYTWSAGDDATMQGNSWNWNGVSEVTPGGKWITTSQNNDTYSYTCKVNSEAITFSTGDQESSIQSITCNLVQSGSTGSGETSTTEGTCIDQQIIDSGNGWSCTFTNLPLTGKDTEGNTVNYYYYVQEVSVSGYETSYGNNGGIQSGTITVTNTATSNPTYELPQTGGHGTMGYTLGGVTLTAGAALWLLCRRKRRREAL